MPFPLAHPAAVLPLRGLGARRLSFAALMIGSIVPDIAYILDELNRFSHTVLFLFGPAARNWDCVRGNWEWSTFSHTFVGSLGFDLPLGALLLAIFFFLRSALAALLPEPHRSALRPLSGPRRESLSACGVSLLLAIWLHLGWDSLTHDDGWFAHAFPQFLQTWFEVYGRRIGGLRVVWFVSTVGGLAALVISYRRFLRRLHQPLWSFARSEVPFYALWFGVFLAPLLVAVPHTARLTRLESSWYNFSYVFHVFSEYYLITLGLVVIAVGLIMKGLPRRNQAG